MLVIDNVVHHTGSNLKTDVAIPKSRFSVSCKTKSGDPFGEPAEFEAVDEGDAIAQYIKEKKIQLASSELGKGSSSLRFTAEAVEENRRDVVNPPEPVAQILGSSKKAKSETPETPTVTTKKKGGK